jgi:carboxyl-terminal processing protease
MQGRFEGIGIYMAMAEGEILVDRPIRGSPAMQAGLQSGDVIVSVDGQAVAELIAGLEEAEAMAAVVERIRGPKGTPVRLEVRRPPQTTTFEVEIVRDEVPLISVNWDMLAGDVAYIQITEFKATTTDELDEALRDLLPQQPRGLVLDLRNNPGGFLTTAQEVLGRFYNGLALREHMSDGTVKELTTISGPREVQTFELPMVVLINGGSASAAEIVAGALRDRRPNTTLLGETTFGKGSVQNIHRLRDGSSTRITIAHWFTPNGDEIHQIGITPEYVVNPSDDPQYALACPAEMRPAEGASACQDAQLVWSMRVLTNSATPPPPAPTPTGRWQRELRSAA